MQGVYYKLGSQMSRHRPSDEPSRVSVQYEGQVEEALVGFHVGYIRDPEAIGRYGSEISTDEIRGRDSAPVPASSTFLMAAEATLESFFSHQPRYPFTAAANTHRL